MRVQDEIDSHLLCFPAFSSPSCQSAYLSHCPTPLPLHLCSVLLPTHSATSCFPPGLTALLLKMLVLQIVLKQSSPVEET